MVNKVILVGYVGKELEIRHTAGGQAVATIRLATSRGWVDKQTGQRKDETEWHDVEVWGKSAEACGKHLEKGGRAYVEGRIKTENWEDKQGQKRSRVKIVAESVRFLGKPNGKSEAQPSDDPDGGAPA
jgi:single-strand DNA-binding protein